MSSKAVRTLSPMSVWDEQSVMADFEEAGVKPKHYIKVMVKLYEDFTSGKITHLDQFEVPYSTSQKVLSILRSGKYTLMTSRVVKREDSRDGATTKILIEMQDGHQVECVLMRYSNNYTGNHKRTTLCVSSQIGCAMACTFCATGTMGLSGNLFGGEILEQFIWANEVEKVRNVVFMGMGEPLHNYDAVLGAIRAMTNNQWFALQQKRVTLSTVGIVPRMFQLFDQAPYVTLALSLHAPTQAMRERIVPSARQYKLEDLVRAIDHYSAATKKDMLIEYVLLDDVNTGEDTAHTLGQLLKGRNVLVNLIPFNPVLTKARHVAPSAERVAAYAQIVAEYGVLVTARKELGQDISGACGQLAVKTKKERARAAGANANAPKVTLLDTAVDEEEEEEAAAAAVKKQTHAHTHSHAHKDEGKDSTDAAAATSAGDEEEDDDCDLIGNGLEGIASAMGVFAPARAAGDATPQEGDVIGDMTGASLANTLLPPDDGAGAGCGSAPPVAPDGTVADLEDLAAKPAAAKPAASKVSAAKAATKAKAAAGADADAEEAEAPEDAATDAAATAKAQAAASSGCGDPSCDCKRPAPVHLTQAELQALCPHPPTDIIPYSLWVIARGPVTKSTAASLERGLSNKDRVRYAKEAALAKRAAAIAAGEIPDPAADAGSGSDADADADADADTDANAADTVSEAGVSTAGASTVRSLPGPVDRRVFFPKGGLRKADPLAPLPEGAVALGELDAFTAVAPVEPAAPATAAPTSAPAAAAAAAAAKNVDAKATVEDASDEEDAKPVRAPAPAPLKPAPTTATKPAAVPAAPATKPAAAAVTPTDAAIAAKPAEAPLGAWAALAVAAACASLLVYRQLF
jgi:sorting nexin-8